MSSQLLDTASKHSFSIAGLADRAWNRAAEAAIKTGWGPVSRLAEAAVVALMQNITAGQLRVLTYSQIYSFPAVSAPESEGDIPELKAELRVISDTFWVRLCLMSDLGFAESYMYGEVECDDLVSLFKIFLENREKLSNLGSTLSYLFALPQKLTSYRFLNTIGNSRSNISAHYDISNEMFAGFLSEDMTYSCAIFPELDGDLNSSNTDHSQWDSGHNLKKLPQQEIFLPSPPSSESDVVPNKVQAHIELLAAEFLQKDNEDELYAAQMRKLHHIIHKLNIPSDRPARVLEIGSGWGSLAIRIAQMYPLATIDTLTLSVQQQTLAQQRIHALGEDLRDRITVHLMDYRAMPKEWEGIFDRVVSVEMIEAVGSEFLEGYWGVVDWAMKKDSGVGVVQVISIPEARYDRYIREIDFIRKWSKSSILHIFPSILIMFSGSVFPGGFLPTLTLLLQTLQAGSKGKLIVDSVSNIGPHYARTLREWRQRFLTQFDSVIVPALRREYPDVMGEGSGDEKKAVEEIEVFKRKWIYYYCYCEVGFTTRTLGDHIITFVREGYQEFGCDVYQ